MLLGGKNGESEAEGPLSIISFGVEIGISNFPLILSIIAVATHNNFFFSRVKLKVKEGINSADVIQVASERTMLKVRLLYAGMLRSQCPASSMSGTPLLLF